jgi:N-methylhydantoinase B/oxoprolinase/acetone carboxylase alpha subunit
MANHKGPESLEDVVNRVGGDDFQAFVQRAETNARKAAAQLLQRGDTEPANFSVQDVQDVTFHEIVESTQSEQGEN